MQYMRTGSHPATTKSWNCVRSLWGKGGSGCSVASWVCASDSDLLTFHHRTFQLPTLTSALRLQMLFRLPTSNIRLLTQNPINFQNGDVVISDPATKKRTWCWDEKGLGKGPSLNIYLQICCWPSRIKRKLNWMQCCNQHFEPHAD